MTSGLAERDDSAWGLPLHPEAICLSEEEMARAAALVDPADEPEVAWMRYLRALALAALSRELKLRDAAITIGPELSPEDPRRLLALNGRATQLLCVSPLAETVEVPLDPWREAATAPQLLLLAEVDEDHGAVQFLGVLDAIGFVAEIRRLRADLQAAADLPLERFGGGLERMLRWVRLLEPGALPRAGLRSSSITQVGGRADIEGLKEWISELLSSSLLVPLPVMGTRGAPAQAVRLIAPEVKLAVDGSQIAEAVCRTPSIWADRPLAEIVLEQEGNVVWQLLASRHNPIEGPIGWPLDPLVPQQRLTIRLRPYGSPGGTYAELDLIAPDTEKIDEGDDRIQRGCQALFVPTQGFLAEFSRQPRAVIAEIRARQWLGIGCEPEEASIDE